MNKRDQILIMLGALLTFNASASDYVAFSTEKTQWTETHDSMTWDKASEYCNSLGTDWRLPTQKELKTLNSSLATLPRSIKHKRLWSNDSASNESFFENNKQAHFYVDIRDGESNWGNHEDYQHFSCVKEGGISPVTSQKNDKQRGSKIITPPLSTPKSNSFFAGRCEGYGFQQGTDGFANCIMQMENAQAQANLEIERRRQLERSCGLARANGFLAPTRTGSFVESAQNANEAYARCMAGLPTPHNYIINCSQSGSTFNCYAQ